jgi:hypothetical protein
VKLTIGEYQRRHSIRSIRVRFTDGGALATWFDDRAAGPSQR